MTRFGRWTREESLGEGGQARTFFASDSTGEHKGRFVLKLLKDSARSNRYPSEVAALRRLAHPRIIRIVDHAPIDITKDRYIVTPYAAGGPLSERARLYREQVDPTLFVAEQLCDALICAHTAGIVHRDLKPANILFESRDSHDCWLADFGICYVPHLPRVTEEHEWAGPRAYIAPELEGGETEPTPAADLYSLGKVIYYMLSGGVDLPRERHREPDFAEVLRRSDLRVQALAQVLDKLLCPLAHRIQEASGVRDGLKEIRGLSSDRHAPSLSADALARLGTRLDADRAQMSLDRENKEIIRTRSARIEEVVRELAEMVIDELESLQRRLKVAHGDVLDVVIHKDSGCGSQQIHCRQTFHVRRSIAFIVIRRATNKQDHLTFVIGSGEPRHTVRIGDESAQRQIPDCPMGLLPVIVPPPAPGPGRVVQHLYLQSTDPPIADPHNRVNVVARESTLGRWPVDQREYRDTVVLAADRFLVHVASLP
jgi:serine/threonine protein kinase